MLGGASSRPRGTPDQLLLLRKHFRKQNRPKCLRKTLLFKKINSNVNFLSTKVYAKVYVVFSRVQSAAGTFPLCLEK